MYFLFNNVMIYDFSIFWKYWPCKTIMLSLTPIYINNMTALIPNKIISFKTDTKKYKN